MACLSKAGQFHSTINVPIKLILTNTVDDSIDYSFGFLSLYMCDTINIHPKPVIRRKQEIAT